MNAAKTYPYLCIFAIAFLILETIEIMYPKNGRQEANQQIQPAVEKLYEAHYFPNRTVIRVKGITSDRTREALTEIEKRYNIEEIIDRSPMGFTYEKITIIAVPKDPNAPFP